MFGEEATATMDRVIESSRTDAGLVQIMVCDDGGYQIAIDGLPIACFYWRANELESCRRTYHRLCDPPARHCA